MSSADDISSSLLAEPTFLIPFFSVISAACTEASLDRRLEPFKKNVKMLPIGQPGVTRWREPRVVTNNAPMIQFNPKNITLVGGAAINVYDFLLGANREHYIEKGTTDLDIVWWPDTVISRPFLPYDNTLYTVVSTSEIYKQLGNVLKEKLKKQGDAFVEQKKGHILTELLSSKYGIHRTKITVDVKTNEVRVAGVLSVSIDLILDDQTVHIADISLHDGASSQKSNTLEFPHTDIVYSNYQFINNIHFDIGTVNVPHLSRLIDQQKRALENRVQSVWDKERRAELMTSKAQTHYRRLRYILDIIFAMAFSNDVRSQMFRSILHKNSKMMFNLNDSYYQLLYYFSTSPYAMAACPWNANQCMVTTENANLLHFLCTQKKSLNPLLCGEPPVAAKNVQPPVQPPILPNNIAPVVAAKNVAPVQPILPNNVKPPVQPTLPNNIAPVVAANNNVAPVQLLGNNSNRSNNNGNNDNNNNGNNNGNNSSHRESNRNNDNNSSESNNGNNSNNNAASFVSARSVNSRRRLTRTNSAKSFVSARGNNKNRKSRKNRRR